MIGADACRDVGGEVAARQARSVAVHGPSAGQSQLLHHFRIAEDDPRIVHDLGQAQDPLFLHQPGQSICIQSRSRGLQIGGGNARREHDKDVQGNIS